MEIGKFNGGDYISIKAELIKSMSDEDIVRLVRHLGNHWEHLQKSLEQREAWENITKTNFPSGGLCDIGKYDDSVPSEEIYKDLLTSDKKD